MSTIQPLLPIGGPPTIFWGVTKPSVLSINSVAVCRWLSHVREKCLEASHPTGTNGNPFAAISSVIDRLRIATAASHSNPNAVHARRGASSARVAHAVRKLLLGRNLSVRAPARSSVRGLEVAGCHNALGSACANALPMRVPAFDGIEGLNEKAAECLAHKISTFHLAILADNFLYGWIRSRVLAVA